jgi:hypothetical protein
MYSCQRISFGRLFKFRYESIAQLNDRFPASHTYFRSCYGCPTPALTSADQYLCTVGVRQPLTKAAIQPYGRMGSVVTHHSFPGVNSAYFNKRIVLRAFVPIGKCRARTGQHGPAVNDLSWNAWLIPRGGKQGPRKGQGWQRSGPKAKRAESVSPERSDLETV